MKRVYILPNLITAASMMCGLLAIFEAMKVDPDFDTACYLIVVAGILDFLDGKVARLTRATSSFGVQFDSLSDLVAFGVAPSVVMFNALTQALSIPERLASGVCATYAICAALRLARFNVQAEKGPSHVFTGLPSPAAAGAMIGLYFVIEALKDIDLFGDGAQSLHFAAPMVIVLAAYLMVSRIAYPSLKQVAISRRKSFDMLVAMVLFAGLLIVLRNYFKMVLVTAAYAYLLGGLLLGLRRILPARARHEAAALLGQPLRATSHGAPDRPIGKDPKLGDR